MTAAGALGSGVCADNTTAQIRAIVERDCQQITPMAPALPMPSSPCATADGEECAALARAAACGQRLSPYSSAVRPGVGGRWEWTGRALNPHWLFRLVRPGPKAGDDVGSVVGRHRAGSSGAWTDVCAVLCER